MGLISLWLMIIILSTITANESRMLLAAVYCRKDPSAFFSFPVTDLIAPGYSLIIKRPMDFSTVKEKVKKEQYQSLEELKVT